MATKSGEGGCHMFLESRPIVATKSSGNQIHFNCHSTKLIEYNRCKQIQSQSSETLLFVFLFRAHHLGLFVLVFWFFTPPFCLFSCFFLPHTPFVLFSFFFIHSHFILFYFIPPFIYFLWFLTPFLFCFPFYFVFTLCFFPFFYCSHPHFPSFFFLPFFSPFA